MRLLFVFDSDSRTSTTRYHTRYGFVRNTRSGVQPQFSRAPRARLEWKPVREKCSRAATPRQAVTVIRSVPLDRRISSYAVYMQATATRTVARSWPSLTPRTVVIDGVTKIYSIFITRARRRSRRRVPPVLAVRPRVRRGDRSVFRTKISAATAIRVNDPEWYAVPLGLADVRPTRFVQIR